MKCQPAPVLRLCKSPIQGHCCNSGIFHSTIPRCFPYTIAYQPTQSVVGYAARDKTAILNYLDDNLVTLKNNLTEDNFERVLAVIWESSAQTLEELIYVCIDNKKPPTYFKTLLEVLKILCDFFYGPVVPKDETLTRMKLLLQLYASDTSDLVSR